MDIASHTSIPLSFQPGIKIMRDIFYYEIAKLWPFCTMLYLSLQFVFPRVMRLLISENNKKWKWIHGTTRSGGKAAEYLSYLLISGGIVIFCSIIAVLKWSDIQTIPIEKRLYATIPEAQLLGATMLSYQVYNFILCFTLTKDCGKIENKLHHFTTALLSFFVLEKYVHYYAFFFVGIAEITNIPLTLVDACRAFPTLRSMIPTINTCGRLVFAISFFVIRIFWWPIVSYQFWVLTIDALKTGRSHNIYVALIFLVSNAGLTLLQFYWGIQLLGFVKSTLAAGSKKKD